MNLKLLTVAVLALSNAQYANAAAWVPNWVDGPAPANFESGPGFNRTYVDLPKYGGHATYTLQSQAPTTGGGTHFSAASTATTPKIATTVKIPIAGVATAAAATATLTAVVTKNALAKAAVALVRINPYVSVALTLGWLANAGYHYFHDTDSFTQSAATIPVNYSWSTMGYEADTASASCSAAAAASGGYGTTEIGAPIQGGFRCDFYTVSSHNLYFSANTYSQGEGTCPIGYTVTGNQCIPGQGIPDVAATPEQVVTGLASKPVSGTQDTAQALDGVVNETIKNGVNPETDGTTPTLTGTTTPIQGQRTTTTLPDGTVTTADTTYTPTYSGNHVDIATTTTNTVVNNNNTSTTTTTGSGEQSTPPPDARTDCDKYPNSIGCAQFGTAPTPEIIPTTNVTLNLSPTSLGAGTCPAPTVMHLSRGDYTMSNQPLCDFATGTAPVLIAIAWLAAGMIVFSPIKG